MRARRGLAAGVGVMVLLAGVGMVTTTDPAGAASSGITVADHLSFPWGVAVDGAGNVYVAENGGGRVQRWAPGATSGVTVAGGHGDGSAANQLVNPASIALDTSGNLYVTDPGNSRVQRWAPGRHERGDRGRGNGAGSAANQLHCPNGVAVDGRGNVYVGDSCNARVQRWAPGATSGVTVAGGNGSGSDANQLAAGNGIAVDAGGAVFVADEDNARVQRWAPGATSGVTVAARERVGVWLPTNSTSRRGCAIDGVGNLYIVEQDRRISRVVPVPPGAVSGVIVAGGNGQGQLLDQLQQPYGAALDASSNIYRRPTRRTGAPRNALASLCPIRWCQAAVGGRAAHRDREPLPRR